MKRILINAILMPILALVPMVSFATPVYACGTSAAAQQVSKGIDETTTASCDSDQVKNTLATIVNILSILIGAMSIIVIMIAAVKYISSGGNESKVSNAKDTLLYAVIGLAVAGVAQLLVHLVLYQTTKLGP